MRGQLKSFMDIMRDILVEHDLFDIVKRIKSIDKNYYVIFNTKRKKYEIHYNRKFSSYELTVPFYRLDCRTVELVLKTRKKF